MLLCAYTHRQQEVKLSSGDVCDVDPVESLNHKNHHNVYHNFPSKSYRQRQSHYPKAVVNVNHTILLAIVHVNHTNLGWGLGSWVLGSWGLGSWGPVVLCWVMRRVCAAVKAQSFSPKFLDTGIHACPACPVKAGAGQGECSWPLAAKAETAANRRPTNRWPLAARRRR